MISEMHQLDKINLLSINTPEDNDLVKKLITERKNN